MSQATIFVQIASYRDDELRKTIASCLEQAQRPDLLRFGIVHQYDSHTEHDLDEYRHNAAFRIHEMHWREARGAGLARHICNTLYEDETFALQIDSHMRFAAGWDTYLIEQWEACNNRRAVLSAHPYDFRYDENGNEHLAKKNYATARPVIHKFHNHTTPILASRPVRASLEVPQKSLFVVGGFIFGPGSMCREATYEKDVAFMGEEVVHSIRLFTNGYTIYKPARMDIYHLYERPNHRRYWEDMTAAQEAAQARIYHETTAASTKLVDRIVSGQEPGRLGVVRSLEEFEQYVGVDFNEKLVHPGMHAGDIPPVAASLNWVEELYPEKDQEFTVDLKDVPRDRRRGAFVRLYDEFDANVWSGRIDAEAIEGLDEHTVTFRGRAKPVAARVHVMNDQGVWERVHTT